MDMLICHHELVSLCAPRSWGSRWGDKGLHKVGSGGNNHPIGYESSTAQTGHLAPCGSKLHMQHHVVVSHVDSTYPKRGCVQVVKHGKTETQTHYGSRPMAYQSNVLGTGKDPGWNQNWSRTVAGWDSLP
jgi:hypothetical protein